MASAGCVAMITEEDAQMRTARLRRFTPASTTSGPPASDATTSANVVDSVALFNMGFDTAAVGRALVEARGDAVAALSLLKKMSSSSPSSPPRVDHEPSPIPDGTDDEARELELAIRMSLEPQSKAKKTQHEPSSSGNSGNPLWAPPRYIPSDHRSLEAGPRTLNLIEEVQVRDGGYSWQRATAFLDTGNQAMTLIDTRFAARHAVYKNEATTPFQSAAGFGMAESWLTLRGVVPGASTRAPVVTIALKVRDQEMLIRAAVSECTGHDLLLGADVIGRLFEAGFRLGAGSM